MILSNCSLSTLVQLSQRNQRNRYFCAEAEAAKKDPRSNVYQRALFDDIASKLSLKNWEDWYNVSADRAIQKGNDLGHGLCAFL
jgi:hypothetical protein